VREKMFRLFRRFRNTLGPQQFIVVHEFNATNAISGQQCLFKPGDRVQATLSQTDEIITIEIGQSTKLLSVIL